MLVSSTSMNAASDTTKAISQGFALGFQSWSSWVSVPAAALIQTLLSALLLRMRTAGVWMRILALQIQALRISARVCHAQIAARHLSRLVQLQHAQQSRRDVAERAVLAQSVFARIVADQNHPDGV